MTDRRENWRRYRLPRPPSTALVVQGEVMPEGQLTLFDLAAIANREHALVQEAGMALVTHAVEAGRALEKAKAQVRHGEWLPWLAANFIGSRQTAQAYMRVSKSQRAGFLSGDEASLRKALEAISADTEPRDHPTIEQPVPPEGKYQVIYADPPWRYEQPGGKSPELRAVERHYPTMSDDEISDLEVPAAADAVCFLWATNPKLREALVVLQAWDFEYRTNIVWVKDRIGMGYYVRGQHELLLIGRRGDFPVPAEDSRPSSVLTAPRTAHSSKPDKGYELIEAMYPNATRVELFARTERAGWASWGALAA